MAKIAIIIPTFNRSEMLLNLLKDIKSSEKKHEIKLIIINDGSTYNYDKVVNYLNEFECLYVKLKYNLGKKGFYKTIGFLYNELKYIDFNYCFGISDDFRLCDNFFNEVIKIWKSIKSKNKICLNYAVTNEIKSQSWTDKKFKEYENYYLSQWIDGAFISEKEYFEVLNYEIKSVKISGIGSGVGRYISQLLIKKGYNIYMTKNSFINHGTHKSVMHTEHRKIRPLTASYE